MYIQVSESQRSAIRPNVRSAGITPITPFGSSGCETGRYEQEQESSGETNRQMANQTMALRSLQPEYPAEAKCQHQVCLKRNTAS